MTTEHTPTAAYQPFGAEAVALHHRSQLRETLNLQQGPGLRHGFAALTPQ